MLVKMGSILRSAFGLECKGYIKVTYNLAKIDSLLLLMIFYANILWHFAVLIQRL